MKKNSVIIFWVVLILLLISRKFLLEKHYGENFNPERAKYGLAKLGESWEKDRDFGKTTFWRKPEPEKGHFKKTLEFGLFGLKNEKDYYKKEWPSISFVFSKYCYEDNSMTYFSISNYNNFYKGKYESFLTLQIEKEEFEEFINNSKTTANTK